MNKKYEEVKPEDLNPGDVVHVSFHSRAEQNLFMNEKVTEVAGTHVEAEGARYFYKEYSRFYLVYKAKKPLSTELGAVVEHTDGWKFIRVGEDDWIGITPSGDRSEGKWCDIEVDTSARKVEA